MEHDVFGVAHRLYCCSFCNLEGCMCQWGSRNDDSVELETNAEMMAAYHPCW